ncbi:hypothetical protein PMZ80_008446 [Knufia obscura]|uniref:Rhodopsin domain-containing protein n=1 Tax=Knufia obscura TaxID=1635080 RepID=A0ABR0RG07_9EURO|nr:hypothetical protein PMZ80_008446 [Knufia obscura]
MAYDDSGRQDRTYGNNGPGATLNTTSIIGIVVGLLLIINRLYWRWVKGTPGIDDLIIVFAWLALLALGVVTYVAVDYGYGRKSITLTRAEASDAVRVSTGPKKTALDVRGALLTRSVSQMFYLYQIFYKLSLNLSKLSILTLYLRVFDTKDWFGKITKFLIFLVISYTTSIIVANVFICAPISTYWNTTLPEDASRKGARCINILGYWYASSLYNILSEALMLFSVLARIWTLPSHSQPPILQFRQKINLTIVLGLGFFTLLTSILRVTTLDQAAQQADKTGGTLTSTIWSSVETCLGLAVANLPMMRQLLRWRGWSCGRWFSSTAGKSRGEHSRRRSEHTPAPQHGSGTNSRRPTVPHISASQIHMQRDFQCEVVTSDDGSIEDVEAQPFRHVEFRTRPSSGCTSPAKSFKNGLISSTEISGGSIAPSIASTLRSPTESMPMVRISTEPSTTSLHSAVMQPMVQAHVKGGRDSR